MESQERPKDSTAAGRLRPIFWVAAVAVFLAGPAAAQQRGFRTHRYEGTSGGSWLFLVERPWYSAQRSAALGLTLDYSHRPLEPRLSTGRGGIEPIVAHALVGHLDLAGSLFDRLLVSASLPVTFLENGTVESVSQVGPLRGVRAGDPRAGFMLRLWGQAERDAFSAHLGADVWIPIGGQQLHQGDGDFRLLPRAVLAGAFGIGRWTLEAGFLYRSYASIGPPALGMVAAPELRVGLAIGVSLANDRLHLGPEAQFSTQVLGENAFAINGMNLELLGGLHYLIADTFLVGVAAGTGLFGVAGTPDLRVAVRLAWAPRHPVRREATAPPEAECGEADEGCPEVRGADADGDEVPDAADRCPFEPELRDGVRDADGCPEFAEGESIARILASAPLPARLPPPAPLAADAGVAGDLATARAVALARVDSDGDGVPDEADRCPLTPEDPDGFEDDEGCPEPDNDDDGIADVTDRCPLEAETFNGEQDEDGCPDLAPDADGDGVADRVDRCPFEPETINRVRDEDGCPEDEAPSHAALSRILAPPPTPTSPAANEPAALALPDSDQDGVPDEADRCPVTPEDRDDFEDEDGCPELDNDEDAVPDVRDQCPSDAETVNGWQDDDGCPDARPDVDGDGVDFAADRCPLEPGSPLDGCPHAALPALALPGFPGLPAAGTTVSPAAAATADFDRDGLPDEADSCPISPEDRDGFEDEDGCPEPDNDRDGIADAVDKCRFEAESINGIKDEDGCPDSGTGAVTVREGAVVLNDVVRFKPGSATLQAPSPALLKQVAGTLRAARSLSVEIQGHTDDTGNAAQNIRLSLRRAEVIRAFLVREGVAANRLVARGFGPTRPLTTDKTAAGREKNRRVEFLILGEAK